MRRIKMSELNVTTLKFLGGYRFKAEFDAAGIPDIVVDELAPVGEGTGPNPTRLLSVAVGHCLSSSLIYCLQKARVKIKNIKTTVRANVERNQQGYKRIKDIEVKIELDVDEEDKARVRRCVEIFENYCTVTESVKRGISVNVSLT
jgi:uncharacterized OsmC-like protein